MKKERDQEKELAIANIKIFPRTHRRLKIQAAETGMSMAKLVEDFSAERARK